MSEVYDVVEGQTSPLDFQLESTDPVTGLKTNPNLAGAAVHLVLRNADNSVVDTAGDGTITDPASAKVRYSPDAGDFTGLAPRTLTGRWTVTIGAEITYFPHGQPDTWRVWKS